MDCNTGQRKAFADDVVASLQAVLKKYELDEVVIHREANPVLVAARGCLKQAATNKAERIELVLQISPSLQQAEEISQQSALAAVATAVPVAKAFDLSTVVARDTVAKASPIMEDPCESESRPG
ncbi:MAG: hypothetical protein F6K04_15565 [Leptolyngbya sp. SIO4C5]|uniref:hypothetical protein n=1 Tax=Sphaerothrix gracilis TaxID=3151835 RepID=UPI0013BEB6F3|nr:hypothetical protein [Leptolyngbya sp. SIO4C5]